MKTAIAVAYIRVSTEMQTEYSPDSQLKLIKEYAGKNNLNLTEIYSDEGISGRKADKRPAFKKMISDAKKKQFDTILIYNTSRFARNHEESIVYRNMLNREGINVVSITQPSVDYKTDILMNALYAVMDERYSIELSENVKRGMKEKVSRGKYISCAPLGYRRTEQNKPLIIDVNESAIVRWIFNEYNNGNTMFAIAAALNQKGYTTRQGNPFDRRGIHRILSNPVYKGFLSWTCDNETIFTKADHEPIITEQQFEEIQNRLQNNVKKKSYKSRDAICAHWLTGIMRCHICGTTYILARGYKGRSDRLRCGNYCNAACSNKYSIKLETAEKLVFDYISKLPFNAFIFEKDEQIGIKNNHLSNNTSEIAVKLEKALERAKQAYLQGIDTIEEYKKNKEALTKELIQIKNVPSTLKPVIKNKAFAITQIFESKTDTDIEVSVKLKNTILRSIVSKIVIDPKDNLLYFYFYG